MNNSLSELDNNEVCWLRQLSGMLFKSTGYDTTGYQTHPIE